MAISFVTVLEKMYGAGLEYTTPYEGAKGSYPAEIFFNHSIPSTLVTKINRLGLKTAGDADKVTDHDVILSNCGQRGGLIQVIFTKTTALEIFERTVRQEYEEYARKEETGMPSLFDEALASKYDIYKDSGPISAKGLCNKMPALKELITGGRRGLYLSSDTASLELLAKSKNALEQAEGIIRAALKEQYGKEYGGLIAIRESEGLEVLEISFGLVPELRAFLDM